MFLKVQQGEPVYACGKLEFFEQIWGLLTFTHTTLLNGTWNKMSLKWMLSGLPSLGTLKEKRKWLSFLFQAICLCLDTDINIWPSEILVYSCHRCASSSRGNPYFQALNIWFLLLDTDHNDSSHCISAVQSCWFICITGYMIVQQRAERLGSEGNIVIITWVTG